MNYGHARYMIEILRRRVLIESAFRSRTKSYLKNENQYHDYCVELEFLHKAYKKPSEDASYRLHFRFFYKSFDFYIFKNPFLCIKGVNGMNEIDKRLVDKFFEQVAGMVEVFIFWRNEKPTEMLVNPEVIATLARIEGFYGRPELQTEVTQHAPVIRYLKIRHEDGDVILMLIDDWDEKLFHLR